MRTKRKTFDCVEMKRQGAARIHERLRGMTVEQQIAYWQERSETFQREQACLSEQGRQGPAQSDQ